MATHYNLIFRGSVYKDQHSSVVRGRLQKLLKASDAQIEVMFSGKAVTIKKAADEPTAERYLDAFGKAGAKLELVQVAAPVPEPKQAQQATPAAQTSPQVSAAAVHSEPDQTFQLAKVGADLVPSSARAPEPESTVTTDHLSLASPGSMLGESSAAADETPPPVDTAHLTLDQPGVRLGVPAPEPADVDALLDFNFELGSVGEILVASKPAVEPELPDLSHLQLESLPATEAEPQEPA